MHAFDPAHTARTLFDLAAEIRYVAIYRGGELYSAQRDNLDGASTAESDRYEELLVNPTVLTLVRQRGNIDCGGLEYVLIRYGNFFEFMTPLPDGHLSVGMESTADAVALARLIMARADLLA